MPVPLSVLDLAFVSQNQDSHAALTATLELARTAEELGYARFWVAEHHNSVGVASTSPAVLLAAIGAHTRRIRLGSGGVMLPNHVPFVIAEQFALLDALYPGRIDLGLGRAPGTDPITAAALRRDGSHRAVDEFPADVYELVGLLGDVRDDHDRELLARLRPTPDSATHPQVWVLGSSLFGAQLAGVLGLPYSYAHHFGAPIDPRRAADTYREHFRASPNWPAPHFMISVSAVTAPTPAEAARLSLPAQVLRFQLRTGQPGKILSPQEAERFRQRVVDRQVFDAQSGTQLGGPAEVVLAGIDELAERTGAAEVLLASTVYDPADRIRTLRELAALRTPA